jgi:hypothetical protein
MGIACRKGRNSPITDEVVEVAQQWKGGNKWKRWWKEGGVV